MLQAVTTKGEGYRTGEREGKGREKRKVKKRGKGMQRGRGWAGRGEREEGRGGKKNICNLIPLYAFLLRF